jgi:tetratricopeptide (TPR) repeat protein
LADDGGGMTEKKGKPSRRRIQVGGEEVDPEKQPKDLSFAEVFRIDKPETEEGEPAGRTYNETHLGKFLMGQLTLGDLEGVTKQQQYQIAEIGHAYLTSGKLDEAKMVFDGLLALDPFDAYFHMSLGSIAQQRNDLDEADARYSRALEINPFSPTAHANRGEIRVMTGRLEEGSADLVKAIQLDPDGKEPATIRAKATVRVLKEQLGAVDLGQLPAKARDASGSKVKAAQETAKAAQARPAPAARPVEAAAKPAGKPAAAAPPKRDPRAQPRSKPPTRGPRAAPRKK